jgi:hypothetical protein
MKRYTESNNIRLEKPVNDRLLEIIKTDLQCREKNFSKSDLIRQLMRMGLKQYEINLQNKLKIQRGERYR